MVTSIHIPLVKAGHVTESKVNGTAISSAYWPRIDTWEQQSNQLHIFVRNSLVQVPTYLSLSKLMPITQPALWYHQHHRPAFLKHGSGLSGLYIFAHVAPLSVSFGCSYAA